MRRPNRPGLCSALVALAVCAACGGKKSDTSDTPPAAATTDARPQAARPATPPLSQTTPNQFFNRGLPTFVMGTKGDDIADRRIAVQVGLIRGLALPNARAVVDTSIDLSKGRAAWPSNPVLYGGANDNAIVAALSASLPFEVNGKKITIGGQVFEGDGYRLVTVVPASDEHPEFLLYSGTGVGGIAEINAGIRLSAPIVIADRFGALVFGQWVRQGDRMVAKLGARQRRIKYRSVRRWLAAVDNKRSVTVRFEFPAMLSPRPDEAALIDACMRGLASVVKKLDLQAPEPMSVYLYPDRRSKQQLTGNGGHGHAVPSSRTLHMLVTTPAGAETLVTHEAAHVLGYYGVGPAGTPLMGEGMAVWVAGGYQGQSLASWKPRVTPTPIATLVGQGWNKIPEQAKYPLAGMLFHVAVKRVGLAKVGQHLLTAAPDTWDAACKAAGTSAAQLESDLRDYLAAK